MTLSPIDAFGFQIPRNLKFGRGIARSMVSDIAAYGKRIVLVHGADASRSAWLREALQGAGATVLSASCTNEPDLDALNAALGELRGQEFDAVVMLGGGSVLDFGKALAALLPAGTDPLQHLEVVGQGLPLPAKPLPSVAIPTTAGTGAEMTKNAVIAVPDRRVKVSLRDVDMIPDLAIVDPALTDGCPKSVTLAAGLDAVTQVIEPYLCSAPNPFTDALCQTAIPRGLAAVVRLMEQEDEAARDNLALCSVIGGISLANSGLGAVHGFAGPLGGWTGGAHGAICGTLLPHVLAANEGLVSDAAKPRFNWVREQIADALGCDAHKAFGELANWIRQQGLPTLADMGLVAEDFPVVARQAMQSSSMRKNPVDLSEGDLVDILTKATQ